AWLSFGGEATGTTTRRVPTTYHPSGEISATRCTPRRSPGRHSLLIILTPSWPSATKATPLLSRCDTMAVSPTRSEPTPSAVPGELQVAGVDATTPCPITKRAWSSIELIESGIAALEQEEGSHSLAVPPARKKTALRVSV